MTIRFGENGSALILAVIAMLVLAVLGVSFALLAQVESKAGVSYQQQVRAEALAEAGLNRAIALVKAARHVAPLLAAPMLVSDVSLNGGTYSARIDNDCAAFNVVPAQIQDTGCPTTTDSNEAAVLTAWATVGNAQARVRAQVFQDDVWRHVCSDSTNDPAGPPCGMAGNQAGNAILVPADPADPHAIRAFSAIPLPVIGCSQINPSLHGESAAVGTCAANPRPLYSQPAAPGYAQYPAIPNVAGPKLVVMGESPTLTPGARTCTGGYFGYFDCALSTPCDPALGDVCPGNLRRDACVSAADPRLITDAAHYKQFPFCSFTSAPPSTGMVFQGSTNLSGNIGSAAKPLLLYVMHDPAASMNPNGAGAPTVTMANATRLIGTLVVEGRVNGTAIQLCTGGPLPTPAPSTGVCPVSPITGSEYGYPLAVLAYNPKLPYPTVTPHVQQPNVGITFTNENINGMLYSGASVTLTPNSSQNGTIVTFGTGLQAGNAQAYYRYTATYSNAAPPPAFLASPTGTPTVLLKTFIACSEFTSNAGAGASDASGPSACQ